MMGTITTKSNSANTKLVDTLEMTDNASLDVYTNGSVVKGEAVINAIKNVKSIGGNLKLKIGVITAMDTDGEGYGYDVTDSSSSEIVAYNVSDSTSKTYINPSASFKCYQVKNENSVIIGLLFEQVDVSSKISESGALSKLKNITMASN
jgi:hypothetical protein